MRKKINKGIFNIPAIFLIVYGALYSFGMLWFADYYGKYIPLTILIGVIGILFLIFVNSQLGESLVNYVFPVLSIIGFISIYYIYKARDTLGESSFLFDYLALFSLLAMFVYPIIVSNNENA